MFWHSMDARFSIPAAMAAYPVHRCEHGFLLNHCINAPQVCLPGDLRRAKRLLSVAQNVSADTLDVCYKSWFQSGPPTTTPPSSGLQLEVRGPQRIEDDADALISLFVRCSSQLLQREASCKCVTNLPRDRQQPERRYRQLVCSCLLR
jgi:hypothetical protein